MSLFQFPSFNEERDYRYLIEQLRTLSKMVSVKNLHRAGHIGDDQCASQVLVAFTFT